MTLSIRQLGAEDAAPYRDLRLLGLKSDPRAFASSYASESKLTLEDHRKTLETNLVLGAFENDRLEGAVAYFVPRQAALAHRGHVWGMIVAPDTRGKGMGKAVLSALIAHARAAGLRQLHLGVGAYNVGAIHLYKQLGFCTYGTEPRALNIDNQDIDEHLMVLFLDEEDFS